MNAEVVFKPIKITIASDRGGERLCMTSVLIALQEESGQAGRYRLSGWQRALKKLLFLDKRKGEDRTAARS